MANYRDWNQALALYFTTGISRGTKLYLSVDNEILEFIGRNFNHQFTGNSWSNDFYAAVKEKVISDGRVDLSNLQGTNANSLPSCVAFLSAMVLAANEMEEEEEISDENYFKRLRAILGLPTSENGRPHGMKPGYKAEEPLWENWNRWLMEQDFLPSAQKGRGRTTYINYPISQSLLRRTDKNRLVQLFNEKQWTAQWDEMTLFACVLQEAPRLPTHLKQLLTDNRERNEAVAEAMHEVYQRWQAEGRPPVLQTARTCTWNRNIFAGIYRTEDPFFCHIDYYPYPKQVRGLQLESIQIQYGEEKHQLRNERPGWYFPLEPPLDKSELESGAKYLIDFPEALDCLVLPNRDFWILIPDPDDSDTGVYATWGRPSLGTKFILLCKEELLSDINRLRDERLIEWSGEPQLVFDSPNWFELNQCMVVSQAWDGIFIKNQALKNALQPTARLSISFSGGLRVPQQNAWLKDRNSKVTIFGFYPTARLTISRLSDESQILSSSYETNIPIPLEFPGTGDYIVKASCGSISTERLIRIVDWNSLVIEKPKRHEIYPIDSGNHICGSVIRPV